ncbi:MAG: hypothetical protein L3J33_01450 [Rhodobacteraceae bacterium]|nr:hypothetical protein [Paracoccaceae bacterium]
MRKTSCPAVSAPSIWLATLSLNQTPYISAIVSGDCAAAIDGIFARNHADIWSGVQAGPSFPGASAGKSTRYACANAAQVDLVCAFAALPAETSAASANLHNTFIIINSSGLLGFSQIPDFPDTG